MKHIFLNLKRFDVPVCYGGVNRIVDGKAIDAADAVYALNVPILAVPAVLLLLATWIPPLTWVAGGFQLLIAMGGLIVWWMPYLAGVPAPWATAGTGVSWSELHSRTYARTLIIVPRIGDRPRPNVEHMILHALFLAAAVAIFSGA